MILSSHGLIASSIGQFDADAQAFFNRVTTAGGTLSATEKTAVNTLVIQMKADGIWTKMKAIYPMVGASAAACSQNLKSSSFTGTFTATGWTFASTGVTGNGTSAFFDSNITPSQMSQDSIHFGVYTNNTDSGYKCGVFTSALTNACTLRGRNQTEDLSINSTLINIYQGQGGLVFANRTDNANAICFSNGVKNTTSATSAAPISLYNFYMAALNLQGTANNFTTASFRYFTIGDGLTDTEASNYNAIVQAFQTTLSRNV